MKFRFLAIVCWSLALTSGASALLASPLTFAQFSEANGTNDFVFTNNGDGTGSFTATSEVYLTFFANSVPAADLLLGPLPQGPTLATLTRTGTINAPAVCAGACVTGSAVSESLVNSVLTITRQSDGALLLESSGSGASLTGVIGGSVANLQNSSPPHSLVFTSDFINFAPAVTLGRSVSFSSLDPELGIAPDGLLNSFSAAATGTFSVAFAPEPGTTSLTMMGSVLAIAGIRRRKVI